MAMLRVHLLLVLVIVICVLHTELNNNQIECSVRLPQRKLIQFCKERGVAVMGYRPLGAPGRAIELSKTELWQVIMGNNYNMAQIASKYNKTTAQVILRYIVSYLHTTCQDVNEYRHELIWSNCV